MFFHYKGIYDSKDYDRNRKLNRDHKEKYQIHKRHEEILESLNNHHHCSTCLLDRPLTDI